MSHVRAAVYYKQKYMKLLEEIRQQIKDFDDSDSGTCSPEMYDTMVHQEPLICEFIEILDNIIGD